MFILNLLRKFWWREWSPTLFKETNGIVWGLVYEIIYKQRHLYFVYFAFKYVQLQLKWKEVNTFLCQINVPLQIRNT